MDSSPSLADYQLSKLTLEFAHQRNGNNSNLSLDIMKNHMK